MNETLQNTLYEQIEAYTTALYKSDLQLNAAGFINENCGTLWLPILLNCIKNIHIFNTKQLNNIKNIANNLRYGRIN